MAYNWDRFGLNEDEQGVAQAQPIRGASLSGGGAGGTPTPNYSAPASPSSPTSFVNFDRYLSANPTAQAQGAQLANSIDTAGTQATNAMNGLSAAGRAAAGPSRQGGSATPPEWTALPGYNDVSTQVTNAAENAKQANTQNGRAALYSQQYAKSGNGYSDGMAAWDSALSGAGNSNAQRFNQLQQKYGSLGDTFNQAGEAYGAQRQARLDEAANAPPDPTLHQADPTLRQTWNPLDVQAMAKLRYQSSAPDNGPGTTWAPWLNTSKVDTTPTDAQRRQNAYDTFLIPHTSVPAGQLWPQTQPQVDTTKAKQILRTGKKRTS